MIEVEGYKAFHGSMKITPVASSGMEPFEIEADWLYKPEYGCWYGNGSSYPEEICEPVEKTADQIFEELGFVKNTSKCYGEEKGLLVYEMPVMHKSDTFEVKFSSGKVAYFNTAMHCIWMDRALIEVILEKMEELGW